MSKSRFKDEEIVILRELGYDINLLEIRASHTNDFSVLEFVLDEFMIDDWCGCARLEKCMKALIDLCDVFDYAIIFVAEKLDAWSDKIACHTTRTLRRLFEAYGQDSRDYYVLSCVMSDNIVRANQKSVIQFVLESETDDYSLRQGLRMACMMYVENLVAIDMVIYTFS